MVEPIYCLKPAWCGKHLAGLRPETGLTVRYGATAFKAVGYHFPQLRSMSLTAPGTFQNLRPFIFRDHALKLNQELIFGAVALWRLDEPGLDSMVGELLNQQDLVRVLAA